MVKELCNTIDKIAEKIGVVIDWSGENVMPYIQDIIQRYRAMSIIETVIIMAVWAIVMTICVIVAIKMAKGIINGLKNRVSSIWFDTDYEDSYYDGPSVFSIVMTAPIIILFLISLIVFGFATVDLIRWIYVPEVKFLEVLKGII